MNSIDRLARPYVCPPEDWKSAIAESKEAWLTRYYRRFHESEPSLDTDDCMSLAQSDLIIRYRAMQGTNQGPRMTPQAIIETIPDRKSVV